MPGLVTEYARLARDASAKLTANREQQFPETQFLQITPSWSASDGCRPARALYAAKTTDLYSTFYPKLIAGNQPFTNLQCVQHCNDYIASFDRIVRELYSPLVPDIHDTSRTTFVNCKALADVCFTDAKYASVLSGLGWSGYNSLRDAEAQAESASLLAKTELEKVKKLIEAKPPAEEREQLRAQKEELKQKLQEKEEVLKNKRQQRQMLRRDEWAALLLEFWGKTHHAGFSSISAEWLKACKQLPIIPATAMRSCENIETRANIIRLSTGGRVHPEASYTVFAYLEHVHFHLRFAIEQGVKLLDGPVSGRGPQLIDTAIWIEVHNRFASDYQLCTGPCFNADRPCH